MSARIPVFIINLEEDKTRREALLAQFVNLSGFSPRIVSGCYGRSLAQNVCIVLTRDGHWAEMKGTIGCFLSHVRAWEEVAACGEPYALVLEDDVDLTRLRELPTLTLPADLGILFVNDRMSPLLREQPLQVLPIWHALRRLDALRSGPGGDGYLLTPRAARKILDACLEDLYYGHVDGRLLRYGTAESDLAELPSGSWISNVVRTHHHRSLVPTLGLIKGYCLSLSLVTHRGIPSIREAEDSAPAQATAIPVVSPNTDDPLASAMGTLEAQ